MRIIIAGSRNATEAQVREAVQRCHWIGFATAIVSGRAKGADEFGEKLAGEEGLDVDTYPADWKLGKRAGPVRNAIMADNAEGLIAVWDGRSRGTANMIELALRRGLRVAVLRVDTGIMEDHRPSGRIADIWDSAEERAALIEHAGGATRRSAEREAGRAARRTKREELGPRLKDLQPAEAFDEYADRLDTQLQAESIPIPRRPFEAWRRMLRDTGSVQSFGDPWQNRFRAWYEQRYGARLAPPNSYRRLLTMLGGEVWIINVPLVYGTVKLVLDAKIIQGATPQFVSRLSPLEQQETAALLQRAVTALNDLGRIPLELLDDWSTAVDSAVAVPPAYGLSKWSAAQVVEKVLGRYIRLRKRAAPVRTKPPHQLAPLVREAESFGLPPLDPALIAAVDCSTAVRYRGENTTAREAVEAQQASLWICALVGEYWTTAQGTGRSVKSGTLALPRVTFGASVNDQAEASKVVNNLLLVCRVHSAVWSTVTDVKVDWVDVYSEVPELAGSFWHIEVSFDDSRHDLHRGNVLHYRIRPDGSAIVALKAISAQLAGLQMPERAYPMK